MSLPFSAAQGCQVRNSQLQPTKECQVRNYTFILPCLTEKDCQVMNSAVQQKKTVKLGIPLFIRQRMSSQEVSLPAEKGVKLGIKPFKPKKSVKLGIPLSKRVASYG